MKKLLVFIITSSCFSMSAMNYLNFPLEDLVKEVLLNPNHAYKALPEEVSQAIGCCCLLNHPFGIMLEDESLRQRLGLDYRGWYYDGRISQRIADEHIERFLAVDCRGKKVYISPFYAHLNAAAHKLVTVPFAPSCDHLFDEVKVWDIDSGACLRTFQDPWITKKLHLSLYLNDKGTRLVVEVQERDEPYLVKILLCNIETGTITPLGAEASQACDLKGDKLITWNGEGLIGVWNVETGAFLKTWQAYPMRYAEVDSSGTRLAAEHEDGFVRTWDIETGLCLATIEMTSLYEANSRYKKFTPSGDQVLIYGGRANEELNLSLYNAETGEHVMTFDLERGADELLFAQFNSSGDRLMTCMKRSVRLWDVHTGKCLKLIKCDFNKPELFRLPRGIPTTVLSEVFKDHTEVLERLSLEQAVVVLAVYAMQDLRNEFQKKVFIAQDGIPYASSQSILFDFSTYPPHVKEIFVSLPDQIKLHLFRLVMPTAMSEALSTEDITRYKVLLLESYDKVILLEKLIRGYIAAPVGRVDLFREKIDACVHALEAEQRNEFVSTKMAQFLRYYAQNKKYVWPESFKRFAQSCNPEPVTRAPEKVQPNQPPKSSFVLSACIGIAATAFVWWLHKNSTKNEEAKVDHLKTEDALDLRIVRALAFESRMRLKHFSKNNPI